MPTSNAQQPTLLFDENTEIQVGIKKINLQFRKLVIVVAMLFSNNKRDERQEFQNKIDRMNIMLFNNNFIRLFNVFKFVSSKILFTQIPKFDLYNFESIKDLNFHDTDITRGIQDILAELLWLIKEFYGNKYIDLCEITFREHIHYSIYNSIMNELDNQAIEITQNLIILLSNIKKSIIENQSIKKQIKQTFAHAFEDVINSLGKEQFAEANNRVSRLDKYKNTLSHEYFKKLNSTLIGETITDHLDSINKTLSVLIKYQKLEPRCEQLDEIAEFIPICFDKEMERDRDHKKTFKPNGSSDTYKEFLKFIFENSKNKQAPNQLNSPENPAITTLSIMSNEGSAQSEEPSTVYDNIFRP